MTTSVPSTAATPEVTAIDTTARGPLLLLIGSALKWLVLSGVLSIITTIHSTRPRFSRTAPY